MLENQYDNWREITGYFDGDGTVGVDVQMFTLGMYLEFSDNWRPQLDMMQRFINKEGVRTYMHEKKAIGRAYALKILSIENVILAARKMLPYACKKQLELQALIEYYNGSVTGEQVIEVFNEEVRASKRVGKVRVIEMPFTYLQGRKMAREFTMRLANQANRVVVSENTRDAIIRDHEALGSGQERLASSYGLSRSVIRRILRERVN